MSQPILDLYDAARAGAAALGLSEEQATGRYGSHDVSWRRAILAYWLRLYRRGTTVQVGQVLNHTHAWVIRMTQWIAVELRQENPATRRHLDALLALQEDRPAA